MQFLFQNSNTVQNVFFKILRWLILKQNFFHIFKAWPDLEILFSKCLVQVWTCRKQFSLNF